MSTRAMYTFKGKGDEEYHVYKHRDGYPTGAAIHIARALKLAWTLPRYEADEFAAGFVAANKTDGGGVRLMHSGAWKKVAPYDLVFRYEIDGTGGVLNVTCFNVSWSEKWTETMLYQGTLEAFTKWAKREAKSNG